MLARAQTHPDNWQALGAILVLGAVQLAISVVAEAGEEVPRFRSHVIDVGIEGRGFGQTALADLTGDGRPEFIMGVAFGPIYVYQYEAPDKWHRYRVAEDSPSEVGLTVLDVNGDGLFDLVTGGAWYLNSGSLNKPFRRIVFDSALRYVHDMAVADIDGDGKSEVLCMSDRVDLRWYRISGNPEEPWNFYTIGPAVHAGLGVGDINGDGRPDVVRSTVWFENIDGGKTWREHPLGPTSPLPADFQRAFALHATKAAVADVNADGNMDVVFTDAEMPGGKVWWMENLDGKGTRWQRHDVFVPAPGAPRRGAFHTLVVADFTGDGALDIFSAEMEWIRGAQPPRWYIWKNLDGTGTKWREYVILDANLGGHECVAGDVTGNGRLDILGKPWVAHPQNALGGKSFVIFLENITGQ